MGRPKSILIVTYEFPPIIGGAGVYAHDLAIGLRKLSHNVNVLTYDHGKGFKEVKKELTKYFIKVYTIRNIKFLHFFLFLIKFNSLCKSNNYDLIIFSDGRAKKIGALSYSFVKSLLSKSISIMHGNEEQAFFKSPSYLLRLINMKKRLTKFFDAQKGIVVASKSEFEIWNDTSIRSKIHLVNHGVNTDIFDRKSLEEINLLKLKYNIEKDERVIFTASRLVKEKGQEILIKCFKKLTDRYKDIRLVIAGAGPYEETLKEFVSSKNLEKKITFLGGVDRLILAELYAISEFFILPSQFKESFGLVYIEAAACGKISIAGNRGGTADAVLDNITGFLVDPEDEQEILKTIELLLNNIILRENMEYEAYLRARSAFSNIRMANQILAI